MKKLKLTFIIFIIIGIITVSGVFMVNWFVKLSTKDKIIENYTNIKDADAILILGCEVKPDGSLSLMLKDRLDKGIELYKNGVATKVIVSGDHGRDDYDEVNAMKKYMIQNEVPSEDIFMDHAGFNTYDSMYRAKNIFNVNKCVVVTQKYHLYRSIYIGNALEMETYGVPAQNIKYVGQLGRDIREVLARDKDVVKCIFKPQATYMGDTIPVSSNGDITNDK